MNEKWFALLLLGVVCIVGGALYNKGYVAGEAIGEAAVSALKTKHAEEKRRDADAYGKALADTLDKYKAEVARGNALAGAMIEEREQHAREAETLERRIAAVAGGGTHTFSREFVCMLNAAAGVHDAAVPGALCTGGADAAGTACAAFGPGLLEQFDGVSEADLLAWFIKYADRCRSLETTVSGWQALLGDE